LADFSRGASQPYVAQNAKSRISGDSAPEIAMYATAFSQPPRPFHPCLTNLTKKFTTQLTLASNATVTIE
jgi:hypothetical protein